MTEFRTTIPPPEYPFKLDHRSRIVTIGSCFAETIGQRLADHKIDTVINPFGILFNPFSIMNALERMLHDRPYDPSELVQHGDAFHSLDHHGRFSASDASECLMAINDSLQAGAAALRSADALFITLGSAWTYRHRERDHVVANCHKIPQQHFEKRLLSFQDVHLILDHIPALLRSKGIRAQIVFTLSPVRHWKDGAIENQRSKAILLAALHQVVDAHEQCHYFPGYEWMMDDLRDYRFYASDMLHPSPQAIDYIWENFSQSFLTDECRIICQEIKGVLQAAQHRPVDPESNSFQRFITKQIDLINGLQARYPDLDLSSERRHFESFRL